MKNEKCLNKQKQNQDTILYPRQDQDTIVYPDTNKLSQNWMVMIIYILYLLIYYIFKKMLN